VLELDAANLRAFVERHDPKPAGKAGKDANGKASGGGGGGTATGLSTPSSSNSSSAPNSTPPNLGPLFRRTLLFPQRWPAGDDAAAAAEATAALSVSVYDTNKCGDTGGGASGVGEGPGPARAAAMAARLSSVLGYQRWAAASAAAANAAAANPASAAPAVSQTAATAASVAATTAAAGVLTVPWARSSGGGDDGLFDVRGFLRPAAVFPESPDAPLKVRASLL